MKKIALLCLSFLLCFCFSFLAAAEAEKTEATEYVFQLTADEPQYVENLIFSEPVTIRGDYGQIFFTNCDFGADVILEADVFTRVFIMPDCTAAGSLILKNNVKEATLETAFPKFLIFAPVPVVCEDCAGVVIALGTFDIMFNGETYSLSDAQLFLDNANPEAGMVPYDGQEANCYMVGQWWENGEKTILIECEYDPGM